MKNLTIKSLSIASALLLAACGGGSGSNGSAETNTTGPTPNPDSRLIGLFNEPRCQSIDGASANTATQFNSDGTYDFIYTSYLFQNCSVPAYTVEYSGNYFEGSTSTSDNGLEIVELDLQQTTQRSVTPLSELAVAELNSQMVCDITDWQFMVPQSVEGCVLGGNQESVILPTIYQIYHLQENHYLYLSQEASFVPENRPANLPVVPILVRELAPADDFAPEELGVWRSENSRVFLEFRPDGIFYLYTENEADACFSIAMEPFLHQGANLYTGFDGESFQLTTTAEGLLFGPPEQNNPALFMRDNEQTLQQLDRC